MEVEPEDFIMVRETRQSRKRTAPGPSAKDKESPSKTSRKASQPKDVVDEPKPSTSVAAEMNWTGKKKIAKVIFIFYRFEEEKYRSRFFW